MMMEIVPMGAQEHLHLKNPPIVEAAIGITIPKLPDSNLDKLKGCVVASDQRPYQGPFQLYQNQLEMKIIDGRSTAITKDEHFGWRWTSNDNLHTVQFKLDGFGFSQLGHYETWETFTADARRVWKLYYDAIGPVAIGAYGVRYLNKVYLPLRQPLEKFLTVYPKTPDVDRPWIIAESALRFALPIDTPRKGNFIHQHLLVPSDKAEYASVILDNDFRYSAEGIPENELWANIDAVRVVKDDYFRQLLTPEFLETFNV
jgi:uncharacterized protein (TIGR04255 family)